MRLKNIASVRTGAVISRLQAGEGEETSFVYELLSLRDIDEYGRIVRGEFARVRLKSKVPEELFTMAGDILVRLSSPYTAVYIGEDDVGLLIPSHFAIIRTKPAQSAFVYAVLDSDAARRNFILNGSGSTALGTISSKAILDLEIPNVTTKKQKAIGEYHKYAKMEIQLLSDLAKEKSRALALTNAKLMKY